MKKRPQNVLDQNQITTCCIQPIGSPAMNIALVSWLPQVCHCCFQSTPLPSHWVCSGNFSASIQREEQRFPVSLQPPSAAGTPAFSPLFHHTHTMSFLPHSVALVCTSVTKNKPPNLRDSSPATSPLAFALRRSSPARTCPCCQNCCKKK